MTKTRICPECGQEFEAVAKKGKPRIFCSDAHKQAHANRRAARGKNLMAIAQAWRKSRGSGDAGKFFFGELTAMLDEWNSEDLTAGRMDPVDYAKLVCDFRPTSSVHYDKPYTATRYFDRTNGR